MTLELFKQSAAEPEDTRKLTVPVSPAFESLYRAYSSGVVVLIIVLLNRWLCVIFWVLMWCVRDVFWAGDYPSGCKVAPQAVDMEQSFSLHKI